MGLTLCEKIIKNHLVDGEYKHNSMPEFTIPDNEEPTDVEEPTAVDQSDDVDEDDQAAGVNQTDSEIN